MRASWERDGELARTLRRANACFCDPHHEAMRRSPAAFTVIQITSAIASARLVSARPGRRSMKRFFYLVVLMALSSSAQAGNSFSFVVAGHRITIEAPGDCNSPSCVSVSIPGIYPSRGERDRYDENDEASDAAVPAKPPVAAAQSAVQQQVGSAPVVQPASKPAVEPVASAPPPPARPAASAAPEIAAPPQRIQPANPLPKPLQPKPLPVTPSVDRPTEAVPSVPHSVQVLQEEDDDPSEAPLGDWETEGNK